MTEIIVSHFDDEIRMVVSIAQAKKTQKFRVIFETEKTGHFPNMATVCFLLDRKIPYRLCGLEHCSFSSSDVLSAHIFFSVKNFENDTRITEEINALQNKGNVLFDLAVKMTEAGL
jgi:hypothetical protein